MSLGPLTRDTNWKEPWSRSVAVSCVFMFSFTFALGGCRQVDNRSRAEAGNTSSSAGTDAAGHSLQVRLSGETKLEGAENPIQVKLDSTPINVQGSVELKGPTGLSGQGTSGPLKPAPLEGTMAVKLEGWPSKESPIEIHVSTSGEPTVQTQIGKEIGEIRSQIQESEKRLRDEIAVQRGAKSTSDPLQDRFGKTFERMETHLASISKTISSTAGLPKAQMTDSVAFYRELTDIAVRLGSGLPKEQLDGIRKQIEQLAGKSGMIIHQDRGEELHPITILLIIVVILVAGLFGGIVSTYATSSAQSADDSKRPFGTRISEALAAATFVPGLLFLIRSDVLDKANQSNTNLIALFSLCVIAATIGGPFIQFVQTRALLWMRQLQHEHVRLSEHRIRTKMQELKEDIAEQLQPLTELRPDFAQYLKSLQDEVNSLANNLSSEPALDALQTLDEFFAAATSANPVESKVNEIGSRLIKLEKTYTSDNNIARRVGDIERLLRERRDTGRY